MLREERNAGMSGGRVRVAEKKNIVTCKRISIKYIVRLRGFAGFASRTKECFYVNIRIAPAHACLLSSFRLRIQKAYMKSGAPSSKRTGTSGRHTANPTIRVIVYTFGRHCPLSQKCARHKLAPPEGIPHASAKAIFFSFFWYSKSAKPRLSSAFQVAPPAVRTLSFFVNCVFTFIFSNSKSLQYLKLH